MSSSDSTNTDTSTIIESDSKASSQITTSGLINKFNNILSQTSEFQRYDGSIDNEIFSGGYSHCPYKTRPQCPYYQDKLRLLKQQGLNRNNKKQYFYYPMLSNTNVSNNMDNKNIVNNRNIVSNAFLNYINNKKNKPDQIVRVKIIQRNIFICLRKMVRNILECVRNIPLVIIATIKVKE